MPSTAGDVNSIQIGSNSNIQDGVTVHVARHNPQGNVVPTIIGNNVTIGKPFPTCLSSSALLHVKLTSPQRIALTIRAAHLGPLAEGSALRTAEQLNMLTQEGTCCERCQLSVLQGMEPSSMQPPWRTAPS